jgi:hypothetical protein
MSTYDTEYINPPSILVSVRDYATDNGEYGKNQCACVPGQETLSCVRIPEHIYDHLHAAQWQMLAAKRLNPEDPWYQNPQNLLDHAQFCVVPMLASYLKV